MIAFTPLKGCTDPLDHVRMGLDTATGPAGDEAYRLTCILTVTHHTGNMITVNLWNSFGGDLDSMLTDYDTLKEFYGMIREYTPEDQERYDALLKAVDRQHNG